MIKGYIYKYTYSNGKVYIGQTRVSVEQRHKQHMYASKNPSRRCLCEVAIAKYGEPILETIETIEVDDDKATDLCKKLDDSEIKGIEEYNSTDTTKGYNVRGGGTNKTPEEFILEEKYHELGKKSDYENDISRIGGVLTDIGLKLCVGEKKLTKEEKHIWYRIRFESTYFNKTCFCGLYNSILKKEPMLTFLDLEELLYLEDDELRSVQTFNKIMERAIMGYAQYQSCKVGDVVMKNKTKIIKEYFDTKDI